MTAARGQRVRPSRLAGTVQTSNWAAVSDLLAQVKVAHVGFADPSGQPFVIPIAAAGDGDAVLLHGSTGSRWLRAIADGRPVSAAVTALDGLVVARSAFESSMRYRSAVVFGRCSPVPANTKLRALDVITEALLPGRLGEVRPSTGKELAATLVLRLQVEEFSVKVSDGWPDDPESDVAGPAWAGVVPILTSYGAPEPAPDLAAGIEVPESVRLLR